MIRKTFLITFFAIVVCILLAPLAVSAASPDPKDLLLPPESIGDLGRTGENVSLPHGNFKREFVPAVIKIMLGVAGTMAFVAFTVDGIMLVFAHDNEEMTGKVKKIFIYAIVGLAIIASAYGIIYGVFKLDFK